MSKKRIQSWLWWILVPLGLIVAIPTLWIYVSLTATPLYPNAESVPTAMLSAPSPEWAGAAEQGRQLVRVSVAEQNLPGLSVAVGIGGDVVWAEGFGLANLQTGAPVTPNHRFRIGTASAALTSAAVGLLVEKGGLKLDNEIQTYVPAFPRKQWPVTLRELMENTAGIINDGDEGTDLFTKHCERPSEALQYFGQSSLLFKPGTQYRYSSYGWILVSNAVEGAAGQPFLTFMRDRIFAPLGMLDTLPDPSAGTAGDDFPLVNLIRELIYDPGATRNTRYQSATGPARDQVTPYFTRFSSDPNYGMHVMRPLDYSCYAGASVFVSTPTDLVRFAMAMDSGKLLQPATTRLLQTSQQVSRENETSHGLGWYGKTVTLAGKPTRMIGSDGDSLGGRVASLMTFPEYGIAVAVTSNISHADTTSVATKVAEAFAGRSTPALQ